jgi:Zn ribbon nucleic-acid-binding protein
MIIRLGKYWYKFYTVECVLCGHTDKWKERIYDKPPEKKEERYSYKQEACPEHFL